MRDLRLTHTTVSAGQRAFASASVENWLAPVGVVTAAGAGLAGEDVAAGAAAFGVAATGGVDLAAAGGTGVVGCAVALPARHWAT